MGEKVYPRPEGVPNILWICTDSQRWDTLGCNGNPHVRSPQVDRLAASGVNFTHAFVQNPLCTPSRGSFLTGRYPITTRLRQNGQKCPPDLRPITRTLADHDFACGLSGKFHLNPCERRFELGEDWWQYRQTDWLPVGGERRLDDGYGEWHWDHAANSAHRASAWAAWLHEQGVEDPRRPRDDCPFVQHGVPSRWHQATWCAERAISFIERNADAWHPWLFSVNIFDPHYGFDPPDEFLEPYLDRLDELPAPTFDPTELPSKPSWQRERHERQQQYREGSDRDRRLITAAYYAMCDHIDVQVGRMLDALERTGQRDNTLVIFMSDHGEMLGDHGQYTKDMLFYEGAIRVPLICSWPGVIPGGRTCDDLVEFTDLAPTLLDACRLPPDPAMQGQSLWPLLTAAGEGYQPREDVYCEFSGANPKHGPRPRFSTMVRSASHKLVAIHGSDEGELYDLVADPHELHNLWDDPDSKDVKIAMLARLAARQAWTADPLPERIGVY